MALLGWSNLSPNYKASVMSLTSVYFKSRYPPLTLPRRNQTDHATENNKKCSTENKLQLILEDPSFCYSVVRKVNMISACILTTTNQNKTYVKA